MRPIFLGIFSIEKDDIIAVNNVVFYVKILSTKLQTFTIPKRVT